MIYFHSYYIEERPVRSIIIINIIVIVVVIIIYYCYRIIVIFCPHYLCVVWLVSITQQKKGWYSWLYSLAGTIKTNQNFFFLWQQHYSHPTPPSSHLSILKLWFNFILGLNLVFFCFKLIIIHHHTRKPTYLGSNQPWLLILETLFLTFPLSPTVNSLNNPTTGRRNKSSKQDPRVAFSC